MKMISLKEQLAASPQDEVLTIALEMAKRLAAKCGSLTEAGTEEWKNETLPFNVNKFSLN
jgi:hypothetical protein